MPLRRMPNGEVVDVPANITPEGLKRIERQYQRAARRERRQEPARQQEQSGWTDEDTEISNRVAVRRKQHASGIGTGINVGGGGFMDTVNQGLLMGARPMLSGAVGAVMEGVPNAIRQGDITQIGRAYRVGKGVEDRLNSEYANENPKKALGGEILGAVANPIGTGAGGVRAVARALPEGGRLQGAARALAGQMEAGPVRSAIAAGVTQGGINAATRSDSWSEVPQNLAYGGATGGAAGGIMGGGFRVLGRGAEIIADAMPRNAARTAQARIAKLLEQSDITPERAAREIAVTDARGGDAALMDLSPRLRARAANLSRNINIRSSDALVQRGGERIADRNARFGENVQNRVTDLPETEAYARSQSIEGARRAQGDIDWSHGGPMDKPVMWNDELDDFFAKAPEPTTRAMRNAYKELELRREDPGLIGAVNSQGELVIAPTNFRAYDYMKRGFDTEIGRAIKAGDRPEAQGLSAELQRLRTILFKENPEYAGILATQRDAFQKVQAIELGESAMARLAKDPRKLLRELRAMPAEQQLEARIGIVDALMAKDTKADPVAFMESVYRNKAQREVFEFAFGGKKQLSSFNRWVKREARAREADKLTASGRQSETSRIHMADEEGGIGVGLPAAAGRGFGFGGAVGAIGNVWAKVQALAQGESAAVQDEIAKILMGKAKTLPGDIKEVTEYVTRRERNSRRRATLLGKAGQQPLTGPVASGGE